MAMGHRVAMRRTVEDCSVVVRVGGWGAVVVVPQAPHTLCNHCTEFSRSS